MPAAPRDPPAVAAPAASGARELAGALLLALAVLAVLALGGGLYHLEASRIEEQQRERDLVRVNLLAELLASELHPAVDDLRLLANSEGLRAYLESGSDADLAVAIRRAGLVSEGKPSYSAVRFIDTRGREVFRFNQGGQAVPQSLLQDRSGQPFVQRTSQLPAGTVFVSAITLALRDGQPEQPLRAILRFAMPVFDATGRRRGLSVINYRVDSLISRLEEALGPHAGRLRLLDADGHWMKAADARLEWGHVLPERAGSSLARQAPALWDAIGTSASGALPAAGGFFAWRRIPASELANVPAEALAAEVPHFVIATELPAPQWAEQFVGARRLLTIFTPVLLVLTLLSAWQFRARRRVLTELREANRDLERRVAERTAELQESYTQLRHREQLLEETGSLAHVGGWEFEPERGTGQWTSEAARIHDLAPGEMPPPEQVLAMFTPGDRERVATAMANALRDGTPYELEVELTSVRGARRWVRAIGRAVRENGQVVRLHGAMQDVTDRKRIELDLQAQLQRMHLLERTTRAIGSRLDLASILQVVTRTLEEQMHLDFTCVCLLEPGATELVVAAVGIASEPLATQLALQADARVPIDGNGLSRCVRGHLVHEPDIAGSAFPFPQRLAAGGLRAFVAAPMQAESQVFGVLIAARGRPDSFSSGDCEFLRQLSEHVALAADQARLRSALQTAYEDLRTTQQAVMQQERLRVLGQMASGIAHDINNAISPIMLYTDRLLEQEQGLSPQARENLLTIQQAVSDVAETVARLREFYRRRDAQSELQPVALPALLAQVRELTRARWESIPLQRGVVVEFIASAPETLPAVNGVESEIREALINLVFNAVDAMPRGGRLILRARAVEPGQVAVEVIDTGAGMDEETRRRCLEPFFTTKGERGTGLGLATVYGVMQRHGGELAVESQPGQGTTVRLLFSVAPDGERTPARISGPVPTGLAILLVDDDPILLRSLRESLEPDGHTVTTASGGQEGIAAFQAALQPGARAFDIVFTDLGMPHVDGRRVASTLKSLSPGTPVVLLTGWGERLIAEGHHIPQVDRVLGKPPRLRDLRQALADLAIPRTPPPPIG